MATLMQLCIPLLINYTTIWSKKDQQTLDYACKRCITVYNTPLKRFYKMDTLTYRAICE